MVLSIDSGGGLEPWSSRSTGGGGLEPWSFRSTGRGGLEPWCSRSTAEVDSNHGPLDRQAGALAIRPPEWLKASQRNTTREMDG